MNHLLLGVALLAPSLPALPADSVSLRFAWPDHVVLGVERSFEREEIREPGPAPALVGSASRFVWTGTRTGDRHRIAFSDFAQVKEEAEPTSRDPLVQLEHVSRAVEPLLPTLIVDAAGQPVDLEGVEALRTRLLGRYESIPGIAEDPQARQLVQVITSDQMIAQRALEDWNRMVQVWHGVDAEVGDVQELRGDTGGAAGAPVENVFSYTLESRVPCTPGGEESSCIRLIVAQRPRITGNARAAAQMLLGFDFVDGLGAPPSASLDVRNTFTTDTDPETLLPVRYVKEKTWTVSWVDAEGAARKVGRSDRWTYTFSRIK